MKIAYWTFHLVFWIIPLCLIIAFRTDLLSIIEIRLWFALWFCGWIMLIKRTIIYSNILNELILFILILVFSTDFKIKFFLAKQNYFFCSSWFYGGLIVKIKILLLCLMLCYFVWKMIVVLILDSFKIIYFLFPETELFIKNLLKFTTIKEFKELYSVERLNWFYLMGFLSIGIFLDLINFEPIYIKFFYIFGLESHIIFYLSYNNKFDRINKVLKKIHNVFFNW